MKFLLVKSPSDKKKLNNTADLPRQWWQASGGFNNNRGGGGFNNNRGGGGGFNNNNNRRRFKEYFKEFISGSWARFL